MDSQEDNYKYDSIVVKTINEFKDRAKMGYKKYNNDLDRTDLIDVEYLQHLKEELMDGVLYLNKFLDMIKK